MQTPGLVKGLMLSQPQFIAESELRAYGLPSKTDEPEILNYIKRASSLIDQFCGRVNPDGTGSLIWSTYTERLYLPEGRNVVRLSYKPLVAVSASKLANYDDSEHNITAANTINGTDGTTLSPILMASGRYGYGRRSRQDIYPDLNQIGSILELALTWGGPPQFTPITVSNIDVNPRNGEVWLPAGLYMTAYTEVEVTYNSGLDPHNLPGILKQATAMLVNNFMTVPATVLKGFGAGKLHSEFTPAMIDETLAGMLEPFCATIAM